MMNHKELPLKFRTPAVPNNQDGKERSVGFEFEFTGVEMSDAANLIADLFGGEPIQLSTYEYKVEGTRFGTYSLELDASLFLNKKYEEILASVGIDIGTFKNKDKVEETLREMASTVVPFEIITPPIKLSELDQLNLLVEKLREWKAKGTGSSFFYAFGLHLNPEVPELTAESVLRHLQAYVLLDPWIRKDAEIDISRKLTPYINEYEMDYIRHILQNTYKPVLKNLIGDYLEFDNSRNRPLDLLPVFMHMDPELTNSLLEEDLTSARPTYHYRLPNCSIQDEEWSLEQEWNRWWLVEQLASDKESLQQYAQLYKNMDEHSLFSFKKKWIKVMDKWVQDVR